MPVPLYFKNARVVQLSLPKGDLHLQHFISPHHFKLNPIAGLELK